VMTFFIVACALVQACPCFVAERLLRYGPSYNPSRRF
jgi:hypothetical protein